MRRVTFILVLWLALTGVSPAQWRRLGNTAVDLQLSGLATGPMDRVEFRSDDGRLFARASAGQWFSTVDFETWKVEAGEPAASRLPVPIPDRLPEPGAVLRASGARGVIYAAGRHVWRSDDGGRSWNNLTAWRQTSLLGAPAADLAVAANDPASIAVATGTGIWRSADSGLTWTSCNAALPHLPVRRIESLPRGARGATISFLSPAVTAGPDASYEWQPGERIAWRLAEGPSSGAARRELSRRLGASVTVLETQGEWAYAGSADGRLWTSFNRGADWALPAFQPGAAVEALVVDERDPRRALAVFSRRANRSDLAPPRTVVLRTLNGGLYWDDITSNLPEVAAFGVAADFSARAVYVATLGGIYQADLAAPSWTRLSGGGLPAAPVLDVRLDPAGNQLYAAVYGFGVYTVIAPHRNRDLRVVHAADYAVRPAAPGALLSILGAPVTEVTAGGRPAAVLPSPAAETHIQLPYDLAGNGVALSFLAANQRVSLGLTLQPAAPAIFVDPDGTPLALDAESGVLLDARNPARAASTVQFLLSGLGRVSPDWPVGQPAPLDILPRVVAGVKAYLDGVPLEVLRATLAPGYIGFYLVEVRLPALVNRGPAEFHVEAGNASSNRVRLHLDP
jgi:uncharacterized protein (TIGR03437 family)